MRVTSAATRASALILALGVGLGLVASAWVYAPITVEGHGVLVDASDALVAPVSAAQEGRVVEVMAKVGDAVKAGQPLLRLAFPDRDARLREARAQLAGAVRGAERRARVRAAERAAFERSIAFREEAVQARIEALTERVEWLEDRLADVEKLSRDGIVSRPAVIDARVQAAEAQDALREAQVALTSINQERAEADGRREIEELNDQLEIERLEDELTAQQTSREAEAVLTASIDGVVSSVNTRIGALSTPGAPLIEVLSARDGEQSVKALVFVPLKDGRRVEAGDRVLLTPATMPEGEKDRLIAEVTRVSDTPASAAQLTAALGNDGLVARVTEGGPTFAVYVALERAEDGAGYLWTTDSPPPVALTPGTPIDARLTVERVPLLHLAAPALKRMLGQGGDESAWAGEP